MQRLWEFFQPGTPSGRRIGHVQRVVQVTGLSCPVHDETADPDAGDDKGRLYQSTQTDWECAPCEVITSRSPAEVSRSRARDQVLERAQACASSRPRVRNLGPPHPAVAGRITPRANAATGDGSGRKRLRTPSAMQARRRVPAGGRRRPLVTPTAGTLRCLEILDASRVGVL